MTATVGSVGALPVYKDSLAGPVALVGGELVIQTTLSRCATTRR